MSLELDARQRAMLQEMGITVWQAPAHANTPAASGARGHAAAQRAPVTRAMPDLTPTATTVIEPIAARDLPRSSERMPVPSAESVPAERTPQVGAATPAAGSSELVLRTPVALYASADASAMPSELGSGWLVILESPTPDEPLTGEVGTLLDNMLRAMQLHRHPRTFAGLLARPAPTGDGAHPATMGLQQALSELRPAMVLVLGLGAARMVLGSREPLGRLRAGVHQLADGTPAVVSYDPAYLLRAPDAKAAAWADLCRALSIVRANG